MATLALLGLAQGPLFALCWVLYLSLVHLGQDFLSFQWDILLVETGFLALLLAPWRHLWPRWPRDEPPPPAAAVWLLRLLLFKLMFSSGLTKVHLRQARAEHQLEEQQPKEPHRRGRRRRLVPGPARP